MTEDELEHAYPFIKWRSPIFVRVFEHDTEAWGCRLCIAMNGLDAPEVKNLPVGVEAFRNHMRDQHGREME